MTGPTTSVGKAHVFPLLHELYLIGAHWDVPGLHFPALNNVAADRIEVRTVWNATGCEGDPVIRIRRGYKSAHDKNKTPFYAVQTFSIQEWVPPYTQPWVNNYTFCDGHGEPDGQMSRDAAVTQMIQEMVLSKAGILTKGAAQNCSRVKKGVS
ncbi:hypothetical protein DL768_002172 [Monosporascus sp. mg162]|nr:hypothetical protein DL768_002172 [Monosporascus sp. mg162]